VRTVYSTRYRRLLERLRSARRESALSQAEVAAAFGKPQSFVSKCESGERRIDVLELDRFAQLYGRPLGYFVDEGEAGETSRVAEKRPRRKR
jgi:transcriptional regulator with XRE-family HTH domain